MTFRASAWMALLARLRTHKLMFGLGLTAGLGSLAGGIACAGIGAYLVGEVSTGATTAKLMTSIYLLLGSVMVTALCIWLESWFAHDLAYRVLASLREEVYNALSKLAPANLVDRRSGDVVSAAMADVETLEWFYAHSIGTVVICCLVSPAVLFVLGLCHPLLPLMLLPLLFLVALVPGLLRKRARTQGEKMREALGDFNSEVIDAVQGVRELMLLNAWDRYTGRVHQHGKRLVRFQLSHGLRAGFESSVSRGMTALGMLAVLAGSAWLVSQGQLEPGLYPVTVVLAGASFGPVVALSGIAGQFGAIGAAATRVFDLIHQKPQVREPASPKPLPQGELPVRFNQVTFSYQGAAQTALSEVSFTVEPGETVALVGFSGAGKTTCARLLMRYYDPDKGTVTIRDRDLRDLKLSDLRSVIAPIPQDIYLFDLSLTENIRLGRPSASQQEVEEAAKLAAIHPFIQTLPHGYDTAVGDRGLRFSGGQRQRLAIARALLSGAPILIMDEAASNLDTENERAVQEAIELIKGQRTILMIAHRLSSIETVDRVIVLDNGRIVEQGPPDRLLAGKGPLATLMQAQIQARSFS